MGKLLEQVVALQQLRGAADRREGKTRALCDVEGISIRRRTLRS
jgi:hypothetical protein